MGSSQDSLGSWDERLQLATAMSEVTEADFSVLHEVHERMLDSQRTHNLAQPKFPRNLFRDLGGSGFHPPFFEIWAVRRARTKEANFREKCAFRRRSAAPGSTDP